MGSAGARLEHPPHPILAPVAGIIAAVRDARLGIAGIAPNVRVMVLKVRAPVVAVVRRCPLSNAHGNSRNMGHMRAAHP
jgi:hypothetical protein